METKLCAGCHQPKLLTDFRWKQKAKGIRVSRCRPCDKQRRAETRDPARQRQISEEYQKRRRERVARGEILTEPSKKCSDCGESFPTDSFRWRDKSRGVRVGRCVQCDRKHRAQDYRGKSEAYRKRIDRLHQELRVIVEEAKRHPCMDCGVPYPPYVMDFDHRDPTQKVSKISNLMRLGSRQKLLAEIAKCDLVCANCHRERTYQMQNGGDGHDSRDTRSG